MSIIRANMGKPSKRTAVERMCIASMRKKRERQSPLSTDITFYEALRIPPQKLNDSWWGLPLVSAKPKTFNQAFLGRSMEIPYSLSSTPMKDLCSWSSIPPVQPLLVVCLFFLWPAYGPTALSQKKKDLSSMLCGRILQTARNLPLELPFSPTNVPFQNEFWIPRGPFNDHMTEPVGHTHANFWSLPPSQGQNLQARWQNGFQLKQFRFEHKAAWSSTVFSFQRQLKTTAPSRLAQRKQLARRNHLMHQRANKKFSSHKAAKCEHWANTFHFPNSPSLLELRFFKSGASSKLLAGH